MANYVDIIKYYLMGIYRSHRWYSSMLSIPLDLILLLALPFCCVSIPRSNPVVGAPTLGRVGARAWRPAWPRSLLAVWHLRVRVMKKKWTATLTFRC